MLIDRRMRDVSLPAASAMNNTLHKHVYYRNKAVGLEKIQIVHSAKVYDEYNETKLKPHPRLYYTCNIYISVPNAIWWFVHHFQSSSSSYSPYKEYTKRIFKQFCFRVAKGTMASERRWEGAIVEFGLKQRRNSKRETAWMRLPWEGLLLVEWQYTWKAGSL